MNVSFDDIVGDLNPYEVVLTFADGSKIYNPAYASSNELMFRQFDNMYMDLHMTGKLYRFAHLFEELQDIDVAYTDVVLVELIDADGLVLARYGVEQNV